MREREKLGMVFVFLGFALLAWWAQRDAYRMGVEAGRQDLRIELLQQRRARQLAERGEHLRLVEGVEEES